ncbi:MAG: SRPBCC family protein [Opitutaceae bacterium]|nr:SRPBCC family protein [Opitutaceae bacterium]
MLKKILIGLAAILAVILIVAAFQPADFRVERSAKLDAPVDSLFANVNDHHKFALWNPWMELDPNVKNTFSGPDSGIGSACSWEGNSSVGAGTSTIVESRPNELVRMRMDWRKPMEGTPTVDFTFKPDGGHTVVTWAMYGKNNYIGKLVGLFIDCEEMCGPQFEKGLAKLGVVAAASH